MTAEERNATTIINAAEQLRRRIAEHIGKPGIQLLDVDDQTVTTFDKNGLSAIRTVQRIVRSAIVYRSIPANELNDFFRTVDCIDDQLLSASQALTGLAGCVCDLLGLNSSFSALSLKVIFLVLLGMFMPRLTEAWQAMHNSNTGSLPTSCLIGLGHTACGIFSLLLTELLIRGLQASVRPCYKQFSANLAAGYGLVVTWGFTASAVLLQPEFGTLVGTAGSIASTLLWGVVAIAPIVYRRDRTPLFL